MSYPTAKVHRVNRRKLGRGQYPSLPAITTIISGTTTAVILTFSEPVNVSGNIPVTIAGHTLVSQVITSPTVVTQTWNSAISSTTLTLAANPPNVIGSRGQPIAGATQTR